MTKFKIGDKVIIKTTIGTTNEVREVIDVKFTPIGDLDFETYIVSGGSIFGVHQLELWNPKTDLEGGYKMKEISMNKKYKTKQGADVKIVAIDKDRKYPVIGYYSNLDGDESLISWTIEGRFGIDEESICDLIESNPYADFKIDDKVLVKYNVSNNWYKRYFYKLNDDGECIVFDEGRTSFSYGGHDYDTIVVAHCIKWEDRTDDMVICDD